MHGIDQIKIIDRFRGSCSLIQCAYWGLGLSWWFKLMVVRDVQQRFRMKARWQTWCGQIQTQIKRILQYHRGSYFLPSFCLSLSAANWPFGLVNRGAGYTFGSQVVKKFLNLNKFDHMLRAHQLCMDGYSELFDKQLSTVWSAPNVGFNFDRFHPRAWAMG